jgi:hypothetical protein
MKHPVPLITALLLPSATVANGQLLEIADLETRVVARLRVSLLADIPDGKRSDRLPERVVRRKHPVIPMPVPPGRWDQRCQASFSSMCSTTPNRRPTRGSEQWWAILTAPRLMKGADPSAPSSRRGAAAPGRPRPPPPSPCKLALPPGCRFRGNQIIDFRSIVD